MSSGPGLGVVEHGSVDDVGESAFEDAEGFGLGLAGCEVLGDEVLGVGVDSYLGDGDPMQRGVGLTVPAPG